MDLEISQDWLDNRCDVEERLKLTGDAMPCAWTNVTRILKGGQIHLMFWL